MSTPPQEIMLYALIFACVFMAAQAIIGSGLEAKKRVAHANKRLAEGDKYEDAQAMLAKMRRDRGLSSDGYLRGLNYNLSKSILQSGLKIGPYMIYPIMLLTAIFSAALALYFGRAVPQAVVGGIAGLCLPVAIIKFAVKRRSEKAANQLPEALDIVIRSLKAGHPVPVALSVVAKELPDPIGSEFGMACDEISFGGRVSTALQRIADRVGHDDFDLFAAMIRLQEKTGGNLAELLGRSAATIRARQRMRLKIRAASSEGRVSAVILNMAPIGMFLMVKAISPDFYSDVEDNPLLTKAFMGVAVWMFLGNLVMRRMINFKI